MFLVDDIIVRHAFSRREDRKLFTAHQFVPLPNASKVIFKRLASSQLCVSAMRSHSPLHHAGSSSSAWFLGKCPCLEGANLHVPLCQRTQWLSWNTSKCTSPLHNGSQRYFLVFYFADEQFRSVANLPENETVQSSQFSPVGQDNPDVQTTLPDADLTGTPLF